MEQLLPYMPNVDEVWGARTFVVNGEAELFGIVREDIVDFSVDDSSTFNFALQGMGHLEARLSPDDRERIKTARIVKGKLGEKFYFGDFFVANLGVIRSSTCPSRSWKLSVQRRRGTSRALRLVAPPAPAAERIA